MFFLNPRIKFLERENTQLKDHVEILERQLKGYVKVTKALNKQLMECQKRALKKEK